MNGKFFDLKKEKQDRMIHAALKVFAIHGYKHASTDLIVQEAGISKGLLFHYFKSKLGLYEFIYDYSVRYLILESNAIPIADGIDFFDLIRHIERSKVNAMKVYPYMQQFLNQSMFEDVSEAILTIEDKRVLLEENTRLLLSKADYSKLPTHIDLDHLYNMIRYTIDGLLLTQIRDASFQPELWYLELESYLAMIEQMTYSST